MTADTGTMRMAAINIAENMMNPARNKHELSSLVINFSFAPTLIF